MKKITVAVLCCLLISVLRSYGQSTADGFFNVKNYGAVGDGHTLDTKGFANAIAACVKAGGGTVIVPAGTFVTGTVQLFSNINLLISPGAVIMASPNTNDFLFQKDYGFSGSGASKKLGIIFADHAENVSITGSGIIDGNAAVYMYKDSAQVSGDDKEYTRQGDDYLKKVDGINEAPVMWRGNGDDRPGTQIIFHACKRVTVRDIGIRNANDWSMDLKESDDVKVLGISIDNDIDVPNSDGIDMYDSKNVIIADCDIRAGDDCIAVIGTSNLAVTNCNCTSRSCGIRIGYNVFNDHDSGNLLFNNIRIYNANRGIGIFQRRKGNLSNMIFSNMVIDTRLYPGQWWGHGEPIHISALPGIGSKDVGTISNVRFTNIIAKGEEGIVLYGSAESALKDIRFENVQVTLVRGKFTDINGGNFDLRPTNDSKIALFKQAIPAIYAHYVNGLTIKDMDVRWDASSPSYFTNSLFCDHFEHLTVNGLSGAIAPNAPSTEAVIALHTGNDVVLKNLKLGHYPKTRKAASNRKLILLDNVTGVEMSNAENSNITK